MIRPYHYNLHGIACLGGWDWMLVMGGWGWDWLTIIFIFVWDWDWMFIMGDWGKRKMDYCKRFPRINYKLRLPIKLIHLIIIIDINIIKNCLKF